MFTLSREPVPNFALLCLVATTPLWGDGPSIPGCDGVIHPHQLPAARVEQAAATAAGAEFVYALWTPSVVDTAGTTTVVLTVVVSESPTSVSIIPGGGGPPIPLSPVAPSTFETTLQGDELLDGYRVGLARQRIGRLRLEEGEPSSSAAPSISM